MKASSSTPPTFMATPWIPVGSPKRNSDRMMDQLGRRSAPRGNPTAQPPPQSFARAYRPTPPVAITVPMAAPRVPNAGIGPSPRISTTFSTRLSTVTTTPSRSGVRASPAERSAPPSMKKMSMPELNTNMIRR